MPIKKKRSNPFNHANHNLKACKALQKLDDYNDWVITTAFYSGMKFLEDVLFPDVYGHPTKYGEQNEYSSFPAYVRDCGHARGGNKHRIMSSLIENNVEDIKVINSYEDLKQSCHTARYINYEIGKDRV